VLLAIAINMVYHIYMKTTLELPDALYREIKARAALKGQTVKSFISEALRRSLGYDSDLLPKETGWRAAFGKVSTTTIREVQTVIDDEFSKIEPDEWQ
jgi:hypothetical protein